MGLLVLWEYSEEHVLIMRLVKPHTETHQVVMICNVRQNI